MSFNIDISYPGGKKVDAHLDGFTVHTDQLVKDGGEESAPQPFALFFVSLATCAGIYALEFCLSRKINTEGLAVKLFADKSEGSKLYNDISLSLTLPQGFPEKYQAAIVRSVDLCTVKQHIQGELNFTINLTE